MNTEGNDPTEDPTAALLGRALHDEAATVTPDPSALRQIQQRTSTSGSSRRSWIYAGVGAAAATAAVITVVAIVIDSSDPSSGPAPATQGASTDATPVVSTTTKPMQIYYLGRGNQTHRLFMETHEVSLHDSEPASAVENFLSSLPDDPDYATGWPSGLHVAETMSNGAEATIVLKGPPDVNFRADPNLGRDGGRLAIDALLRTAGAPPGATATFVYNQTKLGSLFGVELPATVSTDDESRAWISIENIEDGQTIRSPVTVAVSGNVFEGTVNWQLLDHNDAKLDDGYVTTSMGQWTEAMIKLGDLDAGTYSIRCFEYSAEDGSVVNLDDKTFTVT